MDNPAVAVLVGTADADNPIQEISLLIEADFNQTLHFAVGIPVSGATLTISTVPLAHQDSIKSLIESLPGGKGFTSYIPSELSYIFKEVGLDGFTMIVDSTPKVASLSLSISTLLPWTIISDVLILKGLSLQIAIIDPTGLNLTRVLIAAKAEFFPQVFRGEFDFTVGLEKQTTWEVSTVSGLYYGVVNLGDLVGGLLGNQDTVPSVLRDIEFSNFGVTATRSGENSPFSYTIYGNVEAAFPILEREAAAQLNIVITKAEKDYSIALDGQLAIGEELFAIELDLATKDSRLTATWSSLGDPLQFSDIGSAFGWNDMPAIEIANENRGRMKRFFAR